MPQSNSVVYLHLVFSTKDRTPFLADREFRLELHKYIGGVSKNLGCPPITIGGVEDHIHIFCGLGRSISMAEWIKEVKRTSSIWVKKSNPSLSDFAWQKGYSNFSVSQSNAETVSKYIENQETRHAKRTFQDELRTLLRKHDVDWDERYLWD